MKEFCLALPLSGSSVRIVTLSFLLAGGAFANERLDKLKLEYDAAMMEQVISKYNAAVEELDSKYGTALDVAVKAASQSGKLDDALALREEKKRVTDKEAMPDEDAPNTPAPLKAMRQKYRDAVGKLQAGSATASVPVAKHYDEQLAAAEVDLTKAGKLDEAKEIRAERDYLKTLDKGGSGPTAAPRKNGQANEVSRQGLSGRGFVFGKLRDGKMEPFHYYELDNSFKVANSNSPNEVTWKIDSDGHLIFLTKDGRATTVFGDPKWPSGAASFSGPFTGGPDIMFLEETTRVISSPAFLDERRLTQHAFELAKIRPKQEDYQMIRLKPGGAVEGAKFDTSAKWSVNASGSLVLSSSDHKTTPEFSETSTWDQGKYLFLCEKLSKNKAVSYRLIEHP